MLSKYAFVLASAATFAKACPGSSTETEPTDAINLNVGSSPDISGTPSVQFRLDQDAGDTSFYVLETTTNGASVDMWFLMPDGMTLPSTFDMFGYAASMVAIRVDTTDDNTWSVDSGTAYFPGCLRAGEQIIIELTDMYLYNPEFDLSDTMEGTMKVTIPNNAAAREFEDIYCP